jgi:hypothetical protein
MSRTISPRIWAVKLSHRSQAHQSTSPCTLCPTPTSPPSSCFQAPFGHTICNLKNTTCNHKSCHYKWHNSNNHKLPSYRPHIAHENNKNIYQQTELTPKQRITRKALQITKLDWKTSAYDEELICSTPLVLGTSISDSKICRVKDQVGKSEHCVIYKNKRDPNPKHPKFLDAQGFWSIKMYSKFAYSAAIF